MVVIHAQGVGFVFVLRENIDDVVRLIDEPDTVGLAVVRAGGWDSVFHG